MAEIFGTSHLFRLAIGPLLFGNFSTCDGLACEVEMEERFEGGSNVPTRFPKRITYSNITLTRALGKDSVITSMWLESQMLLPIPLPGEIVALNPAGKPLVRWRLHGVVPVRWQGPSFSAGDSRAAMETLEIAHDGFFALPLL
ncbi:phage tail protein [Streptomyces lavendulae]|uniref:phage tail protein n=1 Tax=Streptomyces lavendulae TaxID=1914 RepID=UPI0033CA40C2